MASIPTFLYGTAWKEEHTERFVTMAIDAGFRAIDTANQRKHYFEEGVGNALKQLLSEGVVKRKEIFIQTKFTFPGGQDHRVPYSLNDSTAMQVKQSFESSLLHLGVSYLDSLILHGPSTHKGLNAKDKEAWTSMEQLHQEKKVRHLGVSNVDIHQLRELYEASAIKPTFVQNRCYAEMMWDKEIRDYCATKNILYQGFSLLTANRSIISKLFKIANDNNVSAEQIIFRFSQQVGMIPITGTTSTQHMGEDLSCSSISLSNDEVHYIEHVSHLNGKRT